MDEVPATVTVADLSSEEPTELLMADVHSWVVWQFPTPRRSGLCAALHPPEAASGWYPAIVYPEEERLEIYAHAAGPFPTPEEAVAWMEQA